MLGTLISFDVNGYDICEVPTPELREMEETFGDINMSIDGSTNYEEEENNSEGDNGSEG